jgi:hypothetical protein
VEDPVIKRMRARAHQLRRMAGLAHDPQMIEMLIKMAEEVQHDADRLEAAED